MVREVRALGDGMASIRARRCRAGAARGRPARRVRGRCDGVTDARSGERVWVVSRRERRRGRAGLSARCAFIDYIYESVIIINLTGAVRHAVEWRRPLEAARCTMRVSRELPGIGPVIVSLAGVITPAASG